MESEETNRPLSPQPEPKSSSAHLRQGFFYQTLVIIGAAFLLATLFTAWTPGKVREQPSGSPASALFATLPSAPGSPTLTPRNKPLIGIVAGHWQNDSGAVCSDGLQEVDINLKIASMVQKLLVDQGYDVDLLAEFDNRLNGYAANALVSIHADSCDFINNQATGFKVAAAMATKYPEQAARLTACLRSRYGQITGLSLHSTSVTGDMTDYHAFNEIDSNTPAAIIETGFLNLDRQFLTQKPELAAQGIANGVVCYLKNESITLPSPSASQTP
jgi:N-acetylmuramoyl-L-alanine amidase